MTRCIAVCSIGSVDKGILEHIAKQISTRCGLICEIYPEMERPEYAYNVTRCQYDSRPILKRLIQYCKDDTKLLGVTQVDLYVPILKYIFGLAQVGGGCSLISLHRLCPEFYDQPSDPALLLERAEKTAMHELGHALGLTHCRELHCVMYSSTSIENTDFKNPDFCPTCFELFKWYLES